MGRSVADIPGMRDFLDKRLRVIFAEVHRVAQKVDGLSADLCSMAEVLEGQQNDILTALAEVRCQLAARPSESAVGSNRLATTTLAPGSDTDAVLDLLALIEQPEPAFVIRLWSEAGNRCRTRDLAVVPRGLGHRFGQA